LIGGVLNNTVGDLKLSRFACRTSLTLVKTWNIALSLQVIKRLPFVSAGLGGPALSKRVVVS